MAEITVLKAEKREETGSAAARRLRRGGSIPAELYNAQGNTSVQLNAHDFTLMLKRHGEHQIMALEVEGKSAGHVLLKAVQHDPVHGNIIHADFVTVSMDKPVVVNLPVELIGEPVGVKSGGILEQQLSEMEVECLPGDMVDSIPVDVSSLEVGGHLCVSDLHVPAGLTVLADSDIVVASVALPGAEKSEAGEEGEEAEAGAPEAEAEAKGA